MPPAPEPSDVVVDLAAVQDAARPPSPDRTRTDYSWDVDGDVLRDLLGEAG